jgi:hypothetical protein
MRVLLRNKRTKLYYVGRDRSGQSQTDALDFGQVSKATRFTLEQKLPDMEIVVRYDACQGEVPLPVLPEWCTLDERCRTSAPAY